MSLDPDRALQLALLDHLRADAALIALIGDPPRVYDEPPAAPVYPQVLLGRAETRPFGGGDSEGVEHAVSLTVTSRFGGAEEAKAVTAAVRAALHNADLALEDHRLVNLRVTYCDVFRSTDWRATFGILRLRAVTEPL
ncbi:MAG: DUF3168 domain-containing protein [Caulobacteraceae bacterium]